MSTDKDLGTITDHGNLAPLGVTLTVRTKCCRGSVLPTGLILDWC